MQFVNGIFLGICRQ